MKVVIVVGSADLHGNTELQCQSLEDSLKESGFDVEKIRLADLSICHCNGCNKCIDTNRCCIDDDMKVVYNAFDESDVFILSTPVYFSGPSSILKQMIDRFQCRWVSKNESPSGKKIALLCNGGSDDPRFENVISICRAFTFSTRSEWIGESLVSGTDKEDTSELSRSAYKFGKLLTDKLTEDL